MYFFFICSKSQPDDDFIVSKHVAVWVLYKVVLDGYLCIAYFSNISRLGVYEWFYSLETIVHNVHVIFIRFVYTAGGY